MLISFCPLLNRKNWKDFVYHVREVSNIFCYSMLLFVSVMRIPGVNFCLAPLNHKFLKDFVDHVIDVGRHFCYPQFVWLHRCRCLFVFVCMCQRTRERGIEEGGGESFTCNLTCINFDINCRYVQILIYKHEAT